MPIPSRAVFACISSSFLFFAPEVRADPEEVDRGALWHPSRGIVLSAERLVGLDGDDATIGAAPGDPHAQSGFRWAGEVDAPASRMLARAPRLGVDFAIGQGFTLGGSPIVFYSARKPEVSYGSGSTDALLFGASARVGKLVPVASAVALWPRASLLAGVATQSEASSSSNKGTRGTNEWQQTTTLTGVGLALEPIVLVSVGKGSAFAIAPHLDTVIVGRSAWSGGMKGSRASNEGFGPYRMAAFGVDLGFSVAL